MATADEFETRALLWLESWSRLADPARRRLVELTDVAAGTQVLDIGCGSGELAQLAIDCGASVCGIDAAATMVRPAGAAVPADDLRVGDLARLPWPDDTVRTADNACTDQVGPARPVVR